MTTSIPDLVLPKIKHFGLSIDTNSLRAVELDKNGEISHLADMQLPDGVFSDGVLLQREVFIESLKRLSATAKLTTPYVAVCFPEAFAFTRGLTLPHIPLEEIGEAVVWRAKELFPFPIEEIYFDWKLLSQTETEYQLVVVAVQKRIIDPLVDALVSSGMRPLSFEPDAAAIARLLVLTQQQHLLLLDVNKKVAYVTLVEGQKALFTTVVQYPSDGGPGQYVTHINQSIQEILTYYRRKGIVGSEATEVILTGEIASEEWMKQIPFPVKILKTKTQYSSFNKAYAAAIGKIAPPTDPDTINLLPAAKQLFYDTERNTSYYKILLTRLLLFVGLLTVVSGVAYGTMLVERQRLDGDVKRLTARNQAQAEGSQGLLRLNAQAKAVVALAPLRKTQRANIALLATLVPETIELTQVEYDDTKLTFTVSGTARTREALLDFREKLESAEAFGKVTIPLGTLEVPVNVKFSLTFVTTK